MARRLARHAHGMREYLPMIILILIADSDDFSRKRRLNLLYRIFCFIFVASIDKFTMIAEFKVSNFFSIRSEQRLSFIASRDNFMEEEYIRPVGDCVR